MYKRFKRLFDKEEGYILVTSFVVLLVIVILGVVYANLAITQARQAEQHNDRKQAYYYARSGSERAYLELAKGLDKEIEYKFKNFSWDMNEGLKKEINYIDTAIGYCNQKSEVAVGKALKGWRYDVYISKKNPVKV